MPIAMRSAVRNLEAKAFRRFGPDAPRFYIAADIARGAAVVRAKDGFGLEEWRRRTWREFSSPVIHDVSEDLWAYAASLPWLDAPLAEGLAGPFGLLYLAVIADRPPRLVRQDDRPADAELCIHAGVIVPDQQRFIRDTRVQYVDGRRTVVPGAWRSDEWCR